MFPRCSGVVLGLFRGSSGCVPGVFQGGVRGVQGVFLGCSVGVPGVFWECFGGVLGYPHPTRSENTVIGTSPPPSRSRLKKRAHIGLARGTFWMLSWGRRVVPLGGSPGGSPWGRILLGDQAPKSRQVTMDPAPGSVAYQLQMIQQQMNQLQQLQAQLQSQVQLAPVAVVAGAAWSGKWGPDCYPDFCSQKYVFRNDFVCDPQKPRILSRPKAFLVGWDLAPPLRGVAQGGFLFLHLFCL
jgi:hypothetical protein